MHQADDAGPNDDDMPGRPASLIALLEAPPYRREEAWTTFVEQFSPLLLHVTRRVGVNRDESMDMYAHVLDVLQDREFQRLRSYTPDNRSKFSTWLVVVARRICLDFLRARFGRRRGAERPSDTARRTARLQLEHLVNHSMSVDELPATSASSPDTGIRTEQMEVALRTALADLGPDDRVLLRMRFDDNMSAREIAQRLKMPSQFHVYRRLDALLARLKAILASRGVEESSP